MSADHLDAILGSFLPTRLHMRLEGAYESYVGSHVSVGSLATLIHETMHFFQTALTGFGHISWDAHRQLTSFLMTEWRAIARAPDSRRRLPLAHCSTISPAHAVRAFTAHGTAIEWLLLARARFSIGEGGATLAELGSKLLKQPWKANPTIMIAGVTEILQTKDLIESHAYFVEATFVEATGVAPEEAWSKSGLPKKYWLALDWFVEQCGQERRAAFPFVCDLALQTSWEPALPSTEAEWRASSPSWRFVALTEALRRRPDLALEGPSSWENGYAGFSSALLLACDFKPLDVIFAERLRGLQRKPEMTELEKLMYAGMSFRIDKPWCGGNPVTDPALWEQLVNTIPPPLVQVGTRLGGGLGRKRETVELTMELHYQALAAQILGDFSDEAMSESAIECAFAKFGIDDGCEFQRTHSCTGRYQPSLGPPHPLDLDERGNYTGCPFEALLVTSGTSSVDLDLDHFARMPSEADLAKMESAAGGDP